MLIDFLISNFRSIRGTQKISFEASSDNHLEDYYVVKLGKYRILKIATILGANASGKSNVLKAFYLFRDLLLRPCGDKTDLIEYDRFALDEVYAKGRSTMIVNFIVGEAKYQYTVIFDNKVIYSESLKCQPFDVIREHTVYERTTDESTFVSAVKFGEKYRSISDQRALQMNLLHNRTVFGAYLNSNVRIEWMQNIIDWVEDYMMPMVKPTGQGIFKYVSRGVLEGRIEKNDLIDQIRKADVGICNLDVQKKVVELDSEIVDALVHDDDIPDDVRRKLKDNPTRTEIEVRMAHSGHQGEVSFDLEEESGGTLRYYELSGLLLEVIKDSHFLTIDELECKLHPDLYVHFITTYLMNARQSQIVFTTHMREFLADKDLFRDDSVWITEKSLQGDTELYSLADFDSDTLRASTSRYNAYRAGRLGGIPRLGDTYLPYNKD